MTGETVWQKYKPNISPNFALVIDRAIKPRVSETYSTFARILSDLQASPPAETTKKVTVPLFSQVPTHQATKQLPNRGMATIPPHWDAQNWQKPALVIGGLLVAGLIGAVGITTMNRQPITTNSVTQSTGSAPRITGNSPVEETPIIEPPIPEKSPKNSNSSGNVVPPPEIVSTPIPEVTTTQSLAPQIPQTFTPQPAATPENTQPSPSSTALPISSPQPRTNSRQVPALPPGTSRDEVEAALGKPAIDLKGLWGNTRAVVYKVVPNQIDLGYLFDNNSRQLRQTEVSFA